MFHAGNDFQESISCVFRFKYFQVLNIYLHGHFDLLITCFLLVIFSIQVCEKLGLNTNEVCTYKDTNFTKPVTLVWMPNACIIMHVLKQSHVA
jgi:hypothetical protein